jgi:hypothetical protein
VGLFLILLVLIVGVGAMALHAFTRYSLDTQSSTPREDRNG